MMAHVAKMAAEVIEAVVAEHQFEKGMLPIISQTGKKCRINNGRYTNFYNQGSCTVSQMNTAWTCSLFNV